MPELTDAQFQIHLEALLKMYPDLPNPEHEPKRCAYYVKLYLHELNRRGDMNTG